jgi:hypothetical protein
MTNDYKYYLLMCGLFTTERPILKNWTKYEESFMKLIEVDSKIGVKHLIQSIVKFFIRINPTLTSQACSFMNLLYD